MKRLGRGTMLALVALLLIVMPVMADDSPLNLEIDNSECESVHIKASAPGYSGGLYKMVLYLDGTMVAESPVSYGGSRLSITLSLSPGTHRVLAQQRTYISGTWYDSYRQTRDFDIAACPLAPITLDVDATQCEQATFDATYYGSQYHTNRIKLHLGNYGWYLWGTEGIGTVYASATVDLPPGTYRVDAEGYKEWEKKEYTFEIFTVESCYQTCDETIALEPVIDCGDWAPWVYNPSTFLMETSCVCIETITYVDAVDEGTVCSVEEESWSEYDSRIPTKAEVLIGTGVPGKGLSTAPGLQEPFNPNYWH